MQPARRIAHRLLDILDAIDAIQSALEGETYETFVAHRIKRPAVERYFEIISEASRHVPSSVKEREAVIPWKKIADLGNVLRHAYHSTNPAILWDIYENQLSDLEAAIRNALPDYPDVEND
jgi:uncharacterized protein with HEPN domain